MAKLLRRSDVENEGHEILWQALDDAVELVRGIEQRLQLLPCPPVHHAVEIFQPALRLSPAVGQVPEPLLQDGRHNGQLLVQRDTSVLGPEDHLAVLVHALLARNVLCVQGKEERLLTDALCRVIGELCLCGRAVAGLGKGPGRKTAAHRSYSRQSKYVLARRNLYASRASSRASVASLGMRFGVCGGACASDMGESTSVSEP
ncbi:hypothetical protein GMOD_00004524 [Pyrenophora seminiperda CCB06]|uniref:Uncharacterized protein n=1 Tax=Pyrenophora seminiperda CCB06 TaxID=1302712 RepID=A0A3M7M1G1_9PLEO|nr:hypothetical protein GMOD_00004524 [Pyrenophora seminiperda CCB06]